MTGLFVALVGPSGAGKDTLLEFARAAFADRGDIGFATRAITRPADAGGEAHCAMSDARFEEQRACGAFALTWSAHGLQYGIFSSTVCDVAAGRGVIANLSRAVIAQAACLYARVHVVHVTAPAAVLADRLASRGRETAADIATRQARAPFSPPLNVGVSEIVNDRPVSVTGPEFVAAINGAFGAQTEAPA